MKMRSLVFALWGVLLAGCGYEEVEVHLEPSCSNAPAVISVSPPQLGQRIKMVELDGVKLGGGGGLTVVRVEPGIHRLLVRVAKGDGRGSAAQYDHVAMSAAIDGGGTYVLEISPVSRLLQVRDARSGVVVGESRYRLP